MRRSNRFTLLLNDEELVKLNSLSKQLHRSKGDSLRFIMMSVIKKYTENENKLDPEIFHGNEIKSNEEFLV